MDSANLKSDKPNSHAYKKLIFEELIPQNQEEGSSGVHQRTSISAQDSLDPSSSATSESKKRRSQRKALDTWFGTLYKVWMFIQILLWGPFLIIHTIATNDELEQREISTLLISISLLVQCLFAFAGAIKENLGMIEKALIAMKVYVGLRGFKIIKKLLEELKWLQDPKSKSQDSDPSFDLEALCIRLVPVFFTIILNMVPTRKIRDRIISSLQEDESYEKDDVTRIDPVKKLDSRIYVIYKYFMLVYLLFSLLALVSYFEEDSNKIQDAFEGLTYDMIGISYFVDALAELLICLLTPVFLFLVFDGIRKRNLEKVLIAIHLMKIKAVIECIQGLLTLFGIYFEEELVKEILEKQSLQKDHPKYMIYLGVIMMTFLSLLQFSLTCMLGAYKVRDILKTHQKAN